MTKEGLGLLTTADERRGGGADVCEETFDPIATLARFFFKEITISTRSTTGLTAKSSSDNGSDTETNWWSTVVKDSVNESSEVENPTFMG